MLGSVFPGSRISVERVSWRCLLNAWQHAEQEEGTGLPNGWHRGSKSRCPKLIKENPTIVLTDLETSAGLDGNANDKPHPFKSLHVLSTSEQIHN